MLEVADGFRQAGPAYRQRFAPRMLPSHRKAMGDIERCRTPALGGHLRQCNRCASTQYSYHSCRNRHCPKCHSDQARRWLGARPAVLAVLHTWDMGPKADTIAHWSNFPATALTVN